MRESAIMQPRLGAFLTMSLGLLLFFGFVSRIHDVSGAMLSSVRPEAAAEPLAALEEQANRAEAVFGEEPAPETAPPAYPPPPLLAPEAPRPEAIPAPRYVEPAAPGEVVPRERQPSPPRRRYYAVQAGDTLWGIAQREYGNGNYHYLIQQANPWLAPGSLPAGCEIAIPDFNLPAQAPRVGGN